MLANGGQGLACCRVAILRITSSASSSAMHLHAAIRTASTCRHAPHEGRQGSLYDQRLAGRGELSRERRRSAEQSSSTARAQLDVLNISDANEISGSQTGSQRPHTSRHARRRQAAVVAGQRPAGLRRALSGHQNNASYKRGVAGSNPDVPTPCSRQFLLSVFGSPIGWWLAAGVRARKSVSAVFAQLRGQFGGGAGFPVAGNSAPVCALMPASAVVLA